jgi:hypothetical protein
MLHLPSIAWQAHAKHATEKVRQVFHVYMDVPVPSRMITFSLGDPPCSWQDRF